MGLPVFGRGAVAFAMLAQLVQPAPPADAAAVRKAIDAAPPLRSVPLPSPRPDRPVPEQAPSAGSAEPPVATPETGKDDPGPVQEDKAALAACLSGLGELGARFDRAKPVEAVNGCGIEAPVRVEEILPGLSLGGAVLRCETALQLGRWLKTSVQPALAVSRPGARLTGIVPGTTFACRLRNNAATGMLSEHALGNAFDIAAFRIDDGKTLSLAAGDDEHTMEGAFRKAVIAGACLYFSTVLAPGSDAAHETHLHVDIRARKGGYRICNSSAENDGSAPKTGG